MLTLNNISCERGGRVLFQNLGFTVGDCCLVLIKGANGSGKTSLLKIIACLLKPTDGEVLYANEQVTGEHFEEYCSIIQYVGHKNSMKPYLTVYENLEFWAGLRNNQQIVGAAMNFYELEAYSNILYSKLSAGLKRRVALSRLMLWTSEIWLLDEPFANLDKKNKDKTLGLIKARCDQGGSVIIAAHEDVEVEGVKTNIINLEDFR